MRAHTRIARVYEEMSYCFRLSIHSFATWPDADPIPTTSGECLAPQNCV